MARRHRIMIIALCLAATASLLLSACGSQSAERLQSQGVMLQTYSHPETGLTFRYPADFVKLDLTRQSGNGAVLSVAFANPSGAVVGGNALDILDVSVYKLSPAAGPKALATHAAEFMRMAGELLSDRDQLRLVDPLATTTFAGVPALRGEYAFVAQGRPMAGVCYFVPRGKRAFWITAQASRDSWERSGRLLGTALSTFKFE